MYKIYTRMLAERLSKHVDPLLRKSQYGFRKNRSTAHAIHVVRRTIDALFHKAHIDLNLLLLDWSKAFDKVDTSALTDALIAFGIGGTFLKAIQTIFKSQFRVLGQGGFPSSSLRPQDTGIRQGCPLSPLLFVIMLSWLMEGVDRQYNSPGIANPSLPVWDVFYADDTIL